jgi:hypothetical protein
VLCCTAFPSVSALRSSNSSASRPALFVGLSATMAESDFPRRFIIGYGSSPSRCRPDRFLATGRTWDLPVPVQRASTHARFFDHAGSSRRSRLRARLYSLPPSQRRQHPEYEYLCGAQWLAYVLLCRRFAAAFAGDRARLGVDVDRYSFIVSDLHRLLVAGLPAHCERVWTLPPVPRLRGMGRPSLVFQKENPALAGAVALFERNSWTARGGGSGE